jgi:hypothetical protein
MSRRPVNRNSGALGFLKLLSLGFLVVATALTTTSAQENRSSLVRLFQLNGTFGAERPAKINSYERTEPLAFSLIGARLEADNLGFLTRLRSVLTVENGDAKRTITEVEWRLDIYDEALGSLSQRALQADKVNIYPGETAAASSRFGAVLPDRMVVLLQLVRVSFTDGSAWSPAAECALGRDLKTVTCKSK